MIHGNMRGRTQRFRGKAGFGAGDSSQNGVPIEGYFLRRLAQRATYQSSMGGGPRFMRNPAQGQFGRAARFNSQFSKNFRRNLSYPNYSGDYAPFKPRGGRGGFQRYQRPRGKGLFGATQFTNALSRSRKGGRGQSQRGRGFFQGVRGAGRGGRGGRGRFNARGRRGGRGGIANKETLDSELDKFMGDDSVKDRLDAQLDAYFSREGLQNGATGETTDAKHPSDITMDEAM